MQDPYLNWQPVAGQIKVTGTVELLDACPSLVTPEQRSQRCCTELIGDRTAKKLLRGTVDFYMLAVLDSGVF